MSEPVHALPVPGPLDLLLRRLLVDEATGGMRHDVRNKLGSLRNGAFYVRRRLEGQPALLEADPRLGRFLELIDTEAERIGDLMTSRMPPPTEVQPVTCDASGVAAVVDEVRWPGGVRAGREEQGPFAVAGNLDELKVAVFCLLRNAVEAMPERPAALRVRVSAPREGEVAIDVEDGGPGLPAEPAAVLEPFFTTRPGRLGLGLKVARRVAQRWGARLELGRSDLGGVKGSLLLRRA